MTENAEPELSLKEIIAIIRQYYSEAKRSWKILVFFIVLSSAGFIADAWLTKPVYPATLTFMVREDSKNGLSGVAGLLGQFGLGGGASSEYNMDKIVELAKSRHIVQAALFDSVSINGKNDFLANHVIDLYDLHYDWRKDTLLRDFRFTRSDIDHFARRENKALKALHTYMLLDKKAFISASYSKQTSIISLQVSARNESLSILLSEAIYRQLSAFYIEQSTAQSRQTVRNLELRTDSIRSVLTGFERNLARTEDRNMGLIFKEDKVPQKRLGTDVQILNLMYAEAIKNLETASFLLKNATPIFMEIDRPLAPIKPIGASKKWALLFGVLLGAGISLLYIFGKMMRQKLATI